MEMIFFPSDLAGLKLAQGLAQRRVFGGGLGRMMMAASRLLRRILMQEAEQVWILALESLLRLLF